MQEFKQGNASENVKTDAQPPASGEALIEISGLNKVYDTGAIQVHALKDVDLKIDRGEFVAVMGASGSGKSTLMNILGCLDKPTAGTYHLDGEDISGCSDDELSYIRNKMIGFVFQSFNLIPRTSALKNVELPMIYAKVSGKAREERAKILLESVGLGERGDHMPNEISGGQKQRVAIARALANDPQIILADEPTGNLDSRSSVEIMEIFQKLNKEQGNTVIIVTHEPEIADFTDRIVVFRDGGILKDEKNPNPKSPSEILAQLDLAQKNKLTTGGEA